MQLYTAIVQGILLGGLYAAAGLALSLIFGSLRIVNLAHGELVIGGAYLAYWIVSKTSLGPLGALPIVVVVMAVLGFAVYRGLLDRLSRRGPTGPLIATFGIALIAQAAFAGAYGFDSKSLPSTYATTGISVLGARVQLSYLIAFVISAVLATLVNLLMSRTRAGAAVRAAAADPLTAELMGINVRFLQAMVFAGASALAAVGGVMVGISVSFTPTSGASFLVIGFAVVVLGGIGNVAGTFAAAVLLGLVQSLTSYSVGGGYRDLAVYAVFLLVLAIRPQGLFSLNRRAVKAA